MSITGQHTLNLPIIAKNTGKTIAKVKDIIYDPQTNLVEALLIDEAGWFKGAKIILLDHISSIGHDAVMVETEEVIHTVDDVSRRLKAIAEDRQYLTHTEVVTEDGTKLGKVSDIMFVHPGGQVTDLIVSHGVLGNIGSGKKTVKVSDIVTVSDDNLIVRTWTEYDLEQQGQQQGVKGMVNKAGEKMGEFADNVKAKSQQAYGKAKETIDNQTTPEKKAEYRGKADDAMDKTRDALSNAGQRIKEGWDNLKSGASQQKANAQGAVTDKRIEMALGKKVVNVVILSQNDEPLAKPGDLVTHELIQKAEANGMLDKLLNNVETLPS